MARRSMLTWEVVVWTGSFSQSYLTVAVKMNVFVFNGLSTAMMFKADMS